MNDKSFDDYFSLQVFLIVLRETLELAIIISVLLAFIHQSFISGKVKKSKDQAGSYNGAIEGTSNATTPYEASDNVIQRPVDTLNTLSIYKYLKLQIWAGGLLGIFCCLIIGSMMLAVFYLIGNDLWSVTEHYWEGAFSILASVIISVMGIKILRVNKMQEKWKRKLSTLINESNYINKIMKHQNLIQDNTKPTLSGTVSKISEKYAMFILPFVTTLREGMEAIVFVGGIGLKENTSVWAVINAFLLAITIGTAIGILLYRLGNTLSLQWFLIVSTGFLYLIAAGLFSKGVWNFELQRFIDLCNGFDVSETGHGPGSYDITKSVWHVNCCNGELDEDLPFWMVFTAVLGWTNSATYGSVISYNIYWLTVITTLGTLMYEERNGYLPVIPIAWQRQRIAKRQIDFTPLAAPEVDVITTGRVSLESVNSKTPLQFDG